MVEFLSMAMLVYFRGSNLTRIILTYSLKVWLKRYSLTLMALSKSMWSKSSRSKLDFFLKD